MGVVPKLGPILVVLVCLSAPAAYGQQEQRLLKYSVVGWSSCEKKPCWGDAVGKTPVQKLFLDLAAGPRDAEQIESALSGTGVTLGDLETLRLVRRDGARYFLNFTMFTATDVRRVRAVSEKYARSLADGLLARRAEIEAALKSYDAPGADPKAVAYIVLGCFSLDWDGLRLTVEKNCRKGSEKRPDGEYVPYAEEISENSLERIYWGSHNSTYDDVQLTSFGDHFSPRYCLPDLLWRMRNPTPQGNLPDPLKQKLAGVVWEGMKRTGNQLGKMMLALRDADKSLDELAHAAGVKKSEAEALVGLLAELDYVREENGRYRANVPVLPKKDLALVTRLRRIGWEVIDAWLAANYDKVKAELSDTAPMRNGVPYGEGFTQIWHYLFGIANRQLVEAGLFADPYAPPRKYKGYIPTAFWSNMTAKKP
jgi:hypothetical protein